MNRSRFPDEQIIAILREHENGAKTEELCRGRGIRPATFCVWRRKAGGMEVSDAGMLRALEDENARLKRSVADQALGISALKAIAEKTGKAHSQGQGCGLPPRRVFAERTACLPYREADAIRGAISPDPPQ